MGYTIKGAALDLVKPKSLRDLVILIIGTTGRSERTHFEMEGLRSDDLDEKRKRWTGGYTSKAWALLMARGKNSKRANHSGA